MTQVPDNSPSYHRQCLICGDGCLKAVTDVRRVELVRCQSCGLVFAARVPTPDELIRHYAEYSRDTSFNSDISVRRREEWLDLFEFYRLANRLLDVGCGVGSLLNQAKTHGWETYGTEFTDRAVQLCKDNEHFMEQGMLDRGKYARDSFDVVVYSEVIEHINNHREEFREVYSILRPGGLLFVTTPNFDSISRRLLGGRWNVIQYPEHLTYFTPITLARLMDTVGFKTTWIKTSGFSVTRFSDSLKSLEDDLPTHNRRRRGSGDETIRAMFEVPGIKLVKSGLNWALMKSGYGDSIKAAFVKSEAS